MRTAVVGGGAVGGLLAGELARAGQDVVLCVRRPVSGRLTLQTREDTATVDVPVATDPSGAGTADVVLVTTKAQDTAGVAPWLDALCHGDSVVALVQNGVDHAARLPGRDVVPGLIFCAVEKVDDTIVHRAGNTLVLPDTEAAGRVGAALADTRIATHREPDFLTACWRKLLTNTAANPVTALTMRRMDVFTDPEVRDLGTTVLRETIAVGRACGAALTDGDLDGTWFMYDAQPPDSGSSMLFDRLADRDTEHEFLLAPVVDAGREHGVPTPATAVLLTLLRAISAGRA